MKQYSPWSAEEDAKAIAMRLGKASCKEIAREINRPYSSVSVRLTRKFGVKLHRRPKTAEPAVATIPLAELAAHYELGWRVSWFEGGMVGLEWKSGGEVRWP